MWMLSTKTLTPVGVLIPIYLIFRDTGLVIVLTLIKLPTIIWMLYTYFKEIPVEILEAAGIDGASLREEIRYVLTPLALPGIASTMLPNIILAWNEAFWTLNLTAANAAPLTAFIASYSSPEGLICAKLSAALTMTIAPILIMGWFSQKQLVRSMTFGEVQVIPPLDLEINGGEFVVFVGPSGCGKFTLLWLIAGLEDTTSGMIQIDGKDATALPPAKSGLAMVFQSYALYPHISVRKNIAFPLKMAKMSELEIQ